MIGRLAEHGHELVWSTANKLMWWRRLHAPGIQARAQIFGDRARYQWPVLPVFLGESSIIYSFGVGKNVTFELDVIAKIGCQVFAFDPTPRSAQWAREQAFPPQFQFFEFGIAEADGEMEFHPPRNPAHITYSVHMERHQESVPVRAPVRTVDSLMRMLSHDEIDMLKMDVEGCEYAVIDQLASTRLRPRQLLIEFHHGFYGFTSAKTRAAVSTLHDMGYEVFWVSDRGLEYGFVHRDALCADDSG